MIFEGDDAGLRGNIDDTAIAARFHMQPAGLGEEKWCGQIDLQGDVPALLLYAIHGFQYANSRVVDQNIQLAKITHHACRQFIQSADIG
ncbi:Uncharacterised protein [Klebsiella pneumoniae]|nr:Uncharacterised protein [Klebsiella pneumoniae]